MSTKSQALCPWLYPAPDRTWWGYCSHGHGLYLTKEETAEHRKATPLRETGTKPQHREINVPLALPCGDFWNVRMQLYKRSDGSFYYQ